MHGLGWVKLIKPTRISLDCELCEKMIFIAAPHHSVQWAVRTVHIVQCSSTLYIRKLLLWLLSWLPVGRETQDQQTLNTLSPLEIIKVTFSFFCIFFLQSVSYHVLSEISLDVTHTTILYLFRYYSFSNIFCSTLLNKVSAHRL